VKPFHAPALELPKEVEQKVYDMAAKGGPLEGLF
jgi:hypothetical protein